MPNPGPPGAAPSTAGQKAQKRISDLRFYVECLTPPERSLLAVRYVCKIPPQHRKYLLRRMGIARLAFCEVFSRETYG